MVPIGSLLTKYPTNGPHPDAAHTSENFPNLIRVT